MKIQSEVRKVNRKKRRTKEILYNYMEVLAKNYRDIEPEEMTDSICKIYDRLNGGVFEHRSLRLAVSFVIVNLFVCITILVVNFFRRKSG